MAIALPFTRGFQLPLAASVTGWVMAYTPVLSRRSRKTVASQNLSLKAEAGRAAWN